MNGLRQEQGTEKLVNAGAAFGRGRDQRGKHALLKELRPSTLSLMREIATNAFVPCYGQLFHAGEHAAGTIAGYLFLKQKVNESGETGCLSS